MVHRLQLFIRLQISLFLLLFISSSIHAQIQTAFNVGSIGFTGNLHPVFSGPVVLNGENCLVLSNGVRTFEMSQVGYFSNACRLMLQLDAGIQVMAYPNPVVNAVTIQNVLKTELLTDKMVQLQLIDIQGRVIQTYTTSSKKLNVGYVISMSQYANGGYYIKAISSTNNIQVLSIIKSN